MVLSMSIVLVVISMLPNWWAIQGHLTKQKHIQFRIIQKQKQKVKKKSKLKYRKKIQKKQVNKRNCLRIFEFSSLSIFVLRFFLSFSFSFIRFLRHHLFSFYVSSFLIVFFRAQHFTAFPLAYIIQYIRLYSGFCILISF